MASHLKMTLERRKSMMGHLPNRSPSIMHVLQSVQKGPANNTQNITAISAGDAEQMDGFVFGSETPQLPPRASSTTKLQPERKFPTGNQQDSSVILFPKELRDNKFFHSHEFSVKATRFVQEGRRPSSVFSGPISETCRAELEHLFRVNQIQTGSRPVEKYADAPDTDYGIQMWNSPQYLHHVKGDDRENLNGLVKLGRRLEYGKVLGVFREELLSSKTHHKYANIDKHKEVGDSKTVPPAAVVDWSHMNISSGCDLFDAPPRSGHGVPTTFERSRLKILTEKSKRENIEGGDAAVPAVSSPAGKVAASPAPNASKISNGPSKALGPVISNSRFESLRFCFAERDFEKMMPSSMTIIKTKDTTYAFNETKKVRTIESLMPKGGFVKPDGSVDVNNCLQCRLQYDAPLCNLANNNWTRLDSLSCVCLATLIRTQLVKLDLSFNKIQFIDADFAMRKVKMAKGKNGKEYVVSQREITTLARDKVAKMATDMSHEPQSALYAAKKSEFLRKVRLVALEDLIDPTAVARLFESLHTLYLHGNPLDSIEEIFKLAPLSKTLQFLTFHGKADVDAQAAQEKNRKRLLAAFPHLVSINFTTLLPSDE